MTKKELEQLLLDAQKRIRELEAKIDKLEQEKIDKEIAPDDYYSCPAC